MYGLCCLATGPTCNPYLLCVCVVVQPLEGGSKEKVKDKENLGSPGDAVPV